MLRLVRILEMICAVISGVAIFAIMLVNFMDSIGRQIGQALLGAQQMVSFLLLVFFLSSLAIVVRENAHIRVGLVVELLGPRYEKFEKHLVDFAELLCMATLVWMIYDYGGRLARVSKTSPFFEIPFAPIIYFGAGLTLVSLIIFVDRTFLHPRRQTRSLEEGAHQIHKGR